MGTVLTGPVNIKDTDEQTYIDWASMNEGKENINPSDDLPSMESINSSHHDETLKTPTSKAGKGRVRKV